MPETPAEVIRFAIERLKKLRGEAQLLQTAIQKYKHFLESNGVEVKDGT